MRSVVSLSLVAVACTACETFDPPPGVSLVGEKDGSLAAGAPVTLAFTEPVVPESLTVRIVPYVVDGEQNLGDEDDDPATQLEVLFAHTPGAAAVGGTSQLSADARSLTIVPEPALPVGPSLVVLVEKGLADAAGNVTLERQRIKFAYTFACGADDEMSGPVTMPSGAYFLLVEVDEPVETQVQLWAWLDIDPETGGVLGQFTNGDRNGDPNRCPTPCKDTEACQLLPSPNCVTPSTKAGSVDEWPDWVPNPTPPTGYTFAITGCARAQPDGTTAFATEPADTQTQSPPVKSVGITMSGVVTEQDGVVRGSGSFSVQEVIIGDTPSGAGQGSLSMIGVPEADAPADLPRP